MNWEQLVGLIFGATYDIIARHHQTSAGELITKERAQQLFQDELTRGQVANAARLAELGVTPPD